MKIFLIFISLALSAVAFSVQPKDYSWTSQSTGSWASMPCGGGDIGLNVWVEQDELLFYVGQNGAFDENNTLLKQGRFRLKISPNPFTNKTDFKQTLKLNDGHVAIQAGNTAIILWVDVFKPIIHLEVKSKLNTDYQLKYENWRYQPRLIRKGEGQQNSYKWAVPKETWMSADTIQAVKNGVVFYHQNPEKTIFDVAVNQQGMQNVADQMYNPLKNLISGGKMWSEKLQFAGTEKNIYAGTDYQAWIFNTLKPVKQLEVQIALQTSQDETAIWQQKIERTISSVKKEDDRKKTTNWWNNYWQRSFIEARGEASEMTENYTLFRYMLGCNAFSEWPTRFNGGLFTFDPIHVDSTQTFTPDFRKWGGGTYTAQNQRLVYWPMLKSGDFDLMKPQFDFYKRILKNAELRSQIYWNHGGACFTEQMENFGLPNPSEYGWKRPENYDKGLEYNAWLEYQWETALEFCEMILLTNNYANADTTPYIPLIHSTVQFFIEHYNLLAKTRGRKALDGNGHLVLYPASACETYKMANNPVNTIAALKSVIKHAGMSDSLLKLIPPLTFREIDGKATISPAKSWERINNVESPQLYPVFPWRIFGVGKDSLDIARNTYFYDADVQKFRSHVGWKQDNIFAACLGLTEEAKRLNKLKLASGPYRFPAFWGPGFDWSPDHNWGGSGMIGLQEMLLQTTDEGKIILFPAWPRNQDVHFKLHAPQNTVVEASLKNGKIDFIRVSPAIREKDIIIHYNSVH